MSIKENKYKNPLLFTAAMLPVAIVGGVFTGMYTYAGYTDEMKQQLLEQLGGYTPYLMVVGVQTLVYTVICSFLGYIIAEKTGLLKHFWFERKKVVNTVAVAIICGVLFGLDYWIFGTSIPEVLDSCKSITYSNVIASVLYGGIIEEIMLRLFLMSLIAFVLWKLFYRSHHKENIPEIVFVIANVISALLFAAGHLPATFLTFENVGAVVIFRCFLYNGGLGLVFGWLYRKYGIQYAMIGHVGTHIISKAIWFLFV